MDEIYFFVKKLAKQATAGTSIRIFYLKDDTMYNASSMFKRV